MNVLDDLRVAVIGLGYVGLPLAVEFGKQRQVLGFDINEQRVAQLQAGRDNTLETEPCELAAATGLRMSTQADDLAR
jgi:UDP-N-acetyl-D-galactosamine dehydrogenase